MKNLKLPFNLSFIEKIIETYPTPFYIYDESSIEKKIKKIKKAFDWVDFKNFFAVKGLPNPEILKIMKNNGWGADCSSLPELLLAQKAGISDKDIMFTSNQTPANEYQMAMKMNVNINLDDITHIDYLEKVAGLPESLSFRYNPGPLKSGNSIIGNPEEAKYGLTTEQIIDAFKIIKSKGVKYFGLHTMVASNELNEDYFVETARILFDLAVRLLKESDIKLSFINLGGGIGIPYKPNQSEIDIDYVGEKIRELYTNILIKNGLQPKLFMECSRYITGPYGYLVTKVLHEKHIYKEYKGLDACAANLMRPMMYNAYHHITVLGKEDAPLNYTYDIVGSLCENTDKFAIDRSLPKIDIGDILVIHDVGAHGHSMGYNYNGKLRSAELLLKKDGTIKLIRRAETIEDYFKTLEIN